MTTEQFVLSRIAKWTIQELSPEEQQIEAVLLMGELLDSAIGISVGLSATLRAALHNSEQLIKAVQLKAGEAHTVDLWTEQVAPLYHPQLR